MAEIDELIERVRDQCPEIDRRERINRRIANATGFGRRQRGMLTRLAEALEPALNKEPTHDR